MPWHAISSDLHKGAWAQEELYLAGRFYYCAYFKLGKTEVPRENPPRHTLHEAHQSYPGPSCSDARVKGTQPPCIDFMM